MLTSPFVLMLYQIYPQTLNRCVCSPIQLTSGPCLCSVSCVQRGIHRCIFFLLFSRLILKDYFDTYICSLLKLLFLDISHYFVWNSFSLLCASLVSPYICIYSYVSNTQALGCIPQNFKRYFKLFDIASRLLIFFMIYLILKIINQSDIIIW